MKELIQNEIEKIQASENILILYACESGSRAWGFPSSNSDYDVRFLYVRPPEWYLSIEEGRDVVEIPISGDLDINGWDLRKALRLFRKSNPPLLEWLGSPIVYRERFATASQLRVLAQKYHSPLACAYHYLRMAQNGYRQSLTGETVSLKKYFYVLRPLLAIKWLENDLGVVPTLFSELVDRIVVDPSLRHEIDSLVESRRSGKEKDLGERMPVIHAYIEHELERFEQGIEAPARSIPLAVVDNVFRQALRFWQEV